MIIQLKLLFISIFQVILFGKMCLCTKMEKLKLPPPFFFLF